MSKHKAREDGRIVQRITLPDGTKKDVYGHSSTELKQNIKAVQEAAKQGVKLRDRTTVEGWSEQWLSTYKANVRYNTKQMYMSMLDHHILPAIGKLPLKKVCPVDIQTILNNAAKWEIKNKKGEVVKSGSASQSLYQKIMLTARQLFQTAVDNHLMTANPCSGIIIPKPQKPDKIKFLSEEQQTSLLQAMQGTRAFMFCALGNYAGLRREESLALAWLDVDWKKELLHIHNTVEFETNQPKILPLTKSAAGKRDIPIAPPLMEILNKANPKHIDQGETIIIRPGKKSATIKSEILCPAADGTVMSKMAYKRMWQLVTARVPFTVTSHMLRHTYCTMLHKAGIDLRTAQYLMGHSDIRMTAKIYTHIEDSTVETASEKIKKLFSSQSNSQSEEKDT